MLNECLTYRIEVVRRESGRVTSPYGYTTTPMSAGWTPNQVTSETRFIAALLVHF